MYKHNSMNENEYSQSDWTPPSLVKSAVEQRLKWREREILVIEVENEGRTWGTLNRGNAQWQGCSLSSFAPACSFPSTGESREKRGLCFFLFSSTQNSPSTPRSLSLPPHRGVEPTVLGYQKSTLTSCPCPLRPPTPAPHTLADKFIVGDTNGWVSCGVPYLLFLCLGWQGQTFPHRYLKELVKAGDFQGHIMYSIKATDVTLLD